MVEITDPPSDAAARLGLPLHRIGQLEAAPGLRVHGPDGHIQTGDARGYDHFGT